MIFESPVETKIIKCFEIWFEKVWSVWTRPLIEQEADIYLVKQLPQILHPLSRSLVNLYGKLQGFPGVDPVPSMVLHGNDTLNILGWETK